MHSSLSICIFGNADQLEQILSPHLRETSIAADRWIYHSFDALADLSKYIQQINQVDCLVLQASAQLQPFFDQLQQQALFFPTVIVELPSEAETASENSSANSATVDLAAFSYHPALIELSAQQLNQVEIESAINQAISKFIQLLPEGQLPLPADKSSELPTEITKITKQQLRLAEKLKARLDYLGVYYKRNPQNFLRYMTPFQRDEVLQQLKQDYREIILSYFLDQPRLNEMIDNFVNVAFFADVPISQIVEIHMELMDEFSKQLKLEGRSDEILLDYRLTLIDMLAHLCEMYRRSIPRQS